MNNRGWLVKQSPSSCAPGQPNSRQFPLSLALLAAVPQVSPVAVSSLCLGLSFPLCPRSARQPSVPSVLSSPFRCARGQADSLQFHLSSALLSAVPEVSLTAFSSICLGLSLSLCPRSSQQPSVPSLCSFPCRCARGQPDNLQFTLSLTLFAAVTQISPAAFRSSYMVHLRVVFGLPHFPSFLLTSKSTVFSWSV